MKGIQKPQQKLYYSLRQVAEMVQVDGSEIKNWEKTFFQLSPARNRAGNRLYSDKELTLVFIIKELMIERQLDVDTVKQYLEEELAELMENKTLKIRQVLAELKLEVQEIRLLLDD